MTDFSNISAENRAINPFNATLLHSSCTANGARKTTFQRRQNNELVAGYKGLPQHLIHERWEVIDILRRVKGRLKLTDTLISHIDFIMKRIPVAQWEEGGCPFVLR